MSASQEPAPYGGRARIVLLALPSRNHLGCEFYIKCFALFPRRSDHAPAWRLCPLERDSCMFVIRLHFFSISSFSHGEPFLVVPARYKQQRRSGKELKKRPK